MQKCHQHTKDCIGEVDELGLLKRAFFGRRHADFFLVDLRWVPRQVSSSDLATRLKYLPPVYEPYEDIILSNAIDGAALLAMPNEESVRQALIDVGISNSMHRSVLTAKILESIAASIESVGGFVENPEPAPESSPGPQLEVLDKITQSPRRILQQLFSIQGIDVDPENVKNVTGKICQEVRSSVAAGWANGVDRFDCFISY